MSVISKIIKRFPASAICSFKLELMCTRYRKFASGSMPKQQKPDRLWKRAAVTWKSFFYSLGLGSGVVYFIQYLKNEKQKEFDLQRKRQIGKAAIGGKFELIDQNNNVRSSDEFLGKWLLIYFGFTHCPDICPDELEKMVKTVDILQKEQLSDPILPLFISVDPERDTPVAVGKYIKEFSDKFIGLTGTKEQVDKVCKAFRVYYSAGPKDVDKDYIVDHTIIIYLINPEGDFVDYYGQTRPAEEVAQGILFQMVKYRKMRGSTLLDKLKDNTIRDKSEVGIQ